MEELGSEYLTYDALSRNLTQQSSVLGTVSYQYDLAGRRTRTTWPDGFYVTYDVDLYSEPTAIRENGASSGPGVLGAYTYDNLGRRTGLTRGNGTSETPSYDTAYHLSSLAQTASNSSYNETLSYGHNPLGQSTSRTGSNTTYQWSPIAPGTASYSPNGLNQYATVGGASYSYDARGNLTGDGARSYGFDVYNRLTSVSGAGAMSLGYDPVGRLYETTASSTTTRFLYDGVSLIAEYDTSGTLLRRYVHGPAGEPLVWYEGSGTTDRRYLIQNEQGTVIAADAGSGVTAYTYDEYGNPNTWNGPATAPRFRYAGAQMLPEAQLYRMGARVYDPAIGRFLQTDPILFAGGMNLYAYTTNDPVNLIDPMGLADETVVVTACTGGADDSPFCNPSEELPSFTPPTPIQRPEPPSTNPGTSNPPEKDPNKKDFDQKKYDACLKDNANALWYADNIGLWSAGTSISGFLLNAGGAAGWWGTEKTMDKAVTRSALNYLGAREGMSSYFAYENFSRLVTLQNGLKVLGKVGLGVAAGATALSAAIRGYCAAQASS